MNILEKTYQANNQLECVCCGGKVLMLPTDKQENGPIHLFCQMWGHSIKEHDYKNPKMFMTKRYQRYLKNKGFEIAVT